MEHAAIKDRAGVASHDIVLIRRSRDVLVVLRGLHGCLAEQSVPGLLCSERLREASQYLDDCVEMVDNAEYCSCFVRAFAAPAGSSLHSKCAQDLSLIAAEVADVVGRRELVFSFLGDGFLLWLARC